MALIAMACHDSAENQKSWMTATTLMSLRETVDFSRHRLVVVDDASCAATKQLLRMVGCMIPNVKVITNEKCIGTARSINRAWELREKGEFVTKTDNDCLWHTNGWLDKLEQAVQRDPTIGVIGCKRKDLDERPDHSSPQFKSEVKLLPHVKGQEWVFVEKVHHAIGTCLLVNHALLEKIGYLYQPGTYACDDSLLSARCEAAGFYNCFLPSIVIDHIDDGCTPYQRQKEEYAGRQLDIACKIAREYKSGERSIWHGPNDPYLFTE